MTQTRKRRSHKRIFTQKHHPPLQPVYSEQDYNSNDGMLTTVWGPGTWHFLHTMSFNYPAHPTDTEKEQYRNFVLSLQNVLPCGKCRKNLVKNFQKLPLEMKHMETRETFSRYIYEVVNKMLHKKSKLSYEEVRDRYEHFRSRCAKTLREMKRIMKKRSAQTRKRQASSEKGCTEPLYGEKSKCILKIVPNDIKCETLQIDKKCIKRRGGFVWDKNK